ncbi:phosphoesterase [Ideonella dechloratans]|uniref:Phosphoesterase n=1 Tax=Ideonella dechloratans TaxID=36863 RepID=A0A643F797_IDEDE|nr:metallophosphoesterase [Ideonella dechloratans]KAB0574642.1 phosphoesterase [Ideonella dechloratans]UFU10360.1 metallophosphoesterase [Ideonella dechloratans]
MRLQLLSDLHLETETFDPTPAPGAELLVLAGDIDATWEGLTRFADWPVPVIFVPGNHEFDRRDVDEALAGLRARCAELGITLLEHDQTVRTGADGRRVRFLGTVRWSDFDLFGPAQRERAMRAAGYFTRVQQSTRAGAVFDPEAVRAAGLADRAWLETALMPPAQDAWDVTVVITHFAPSLRSADPRYGQQPGTASFCNADDDLIPRADLWLHGHLHCRHDYRVERPGRAPARVVCQARGLAKKGEADGFEPHRLIEV